MADALGPVRLGGDYQDSQDLQCYFQQWAAGTCGLLTEARKNWQETQAKDTLKPASFLATGNKADPFRALCTALKAQHWHHPIEARLACLAALVDANPGPKMHEAIQLYRQQAWNYALPPQLCQRLGIRLGACTTSPAHIHQTSASQRLSQNEKFQRLIEEAAHQYGWLDPAVLLVAETWAWVLGATLPNPTESVSVWIAFQVNQPGSGTVGRLGKLTLHKIPGGHGALSPHPLHQAHCRLESGGRDHFLEGLHQAWWREIGARLNPPQRTRQSAIDFDIWWTLRPMPRANQNVWWPHLTGRSAEVAASNALRGLRDRTAVDGEVIVSAMFAESFPATIDEFEEIRPVQGLPEKLTAQAFDPHGTPIDVKTFVTSVDSVWFGPVSTPAGGASNQRTLSFQDGQKTLVGVKTKAQQWEVVSVHAEITRQVKGYLQRRARQLLDTECAPFVEPHLLEESREGLHGGQPRQERLEGERVVELLTSPRQRLLIRGESGLGKSMLLVWAEELLAKDPRPIIPIRFGAAPREASLSDSVTQPKLPSWHDLFPKDRSGESLEARLKELWQRIFDEVVRGILSQARVTASIDVCRVWFDSKVARGEICWVMDALDQSGGAELSGANDLLREETQEGSILLTARHELTPGQRTLLSQRFRVVEIAPFNKGQIHDFLATDAIRKQLLIQPGEYEWHASHKRKQQWQSLLTFPILARQLKALAESRARGKQRSLEQLRNREAVYDATLGQLVEHGKGSLTPPERERYADHLERAKRIPLLFAEVAWLALAADNAQAASDSRGGFDGEVRESAFDRLQDWLAETQFPPGLLKKINLVEFFEREIETHDGTERTYARWRHKSFGEWFAGQHLVESAKAREELPKLLRDARWRDTVRYALSAAARQGKSDLLQDLVEILIRAGRVFWVWEALSEDRLSARGTDPAPSGGSSLKAPIVIAPAWDTLCRWLVHRDEEGLRAWKGDCPLSELESTVGVWSSLFDRGVREGRALSAAWELVKLGRTSANSCVQNVSAQIHAQFLDEWRALVAGRDPVSNERLDTATAGLVQGLAWNRERDLAQVNTGQPVTEVRYCRVPSEGDILRYEMGSPEDEPGRFDNEKQSPAKVPAFWLRNFPVTNGEYELFDPGHRERRTEYSTAEDQPVVNVSWWECQLLCEWLGGAYRLPREEEWEGACRAGTQTAYWYGREPDELAEHAWFADNSGGRTHSLSESLKHGNKPREGHVNPWGLVDMHGNVWEWCAPPGNAPLGQPCPYRGGSWSCVASFCRSAFRRAYDPEDRFGLLGLRLVPSPSESDSQAQPDAQVRTRSGGSP